jgi:hypothetical protein
MPDVAREVDGRHAALAQTALDLVALGEGEAELLQSLWFQEIDHDEPCLAALEGFGGPGLHDPGGESFEQLRYACGDLSGTARHEHQHARALVHRSFRQSHYAGDGEQPVGVAADHLVGIQVPSIETLNALSTSPIGLAKV